MIILTLPGLDGAHSPVTGKWVGYVCDGLKAGWWREAEPFKPSPYAIDFSKCGHCDTPEIPVDPPHTEQPPIYVPSHTPDVSVPLPGTLALLVLGAIMLRYSQATQVSSTTRSV